MYEKDCQKQSPQIDALSLVGQLMHTQADMVSLTCGTGNVLSSLEASSASTAYSSREQVFEVHHVLLCQGTPVPFGLARRHKRPTERV